MRLSLEERLNDIQGGPKYDDGSVEEAIDALADLTLLKFFCGFYEDLYRMAELLRLDDHAAARMTYGETASAICRAEHAGSMTPAHAGEAAELLARPLIGRRDLRHDLRAPLAEHLRRADMLQVDIACSQVPVNAFFSTLTDLTANSIWEYTYNYEFFDLAPEEETPTLAGFLERVARRHPAKKRDTYLRTLVEPFAALAKRKKGNDT